MALKKLRLIVFLLKMRMESLVEYNFLLLKALLKKKFEKSVNNGGENCD